MSYWMGLKVILYPGEVSPILRSGRGVIVVSPSEYYGIAMNDTAVTTRLLNEIDQKRAA